LLHTVGQTSAKPLTSGADVSKTYTVPFTGIGYITRNPTTSQPAKAHCLSAATMGDDLGLTTSGTCLVTTTSRPKASLVRTVTTSEAEKSSGATSSTAVKLSKSPRKEDSPYSLAPTADTSTTPL
jgi:hypothetical protein